MICNKILGKVTKFGEKRTTLGVATRFMVGGGGGGGAGALGLHRGNDLLSISERLSSDLYMG